jgi:hypothetical protein
MEAIKLSKFDREFFIVFSNGFQETRAKMVDETGGSEAYCLDVLRQIGGNSHEPMSEDQLIREVAYCFTFPERFQDLDQAKNLALLGSWIYWMKGVETSGGMKTLELRLDALKNAIDA